MTELHLKYRPQKFDDVVGQKAIVNSVAKALKAGTSRAFLFYGPSGCGKTTIARIIANTVGASGINLQQVDGATYTSIDDMRKITAGLAYKAMGANPNRVIIIDECHSLSKQAWQSILKATEEPPPHIYWCLCTTEPNKVPATIKTRCSSYELSYIKFDDILEYLDYVVAEENMFDSLKSKTYSSIVETIAEKSGGSMRQALVYLGMCAGCATLDEAREVMSQAVGEKDVIDLCRLIVKGRVLDWNAIIDILNDLHGRSAEGVRIVITAYFTKVLLNTKATKGDADEAERLLAVLDAFSQPYNQNDGFGPLLLSIGGLVYAQE